MYRGLCESARLNDWPNAPLRGLSKSTVHYY